jgi:long-chain acyl-CoA synthetase
MGGAILSHENIAREELPGLFGALRSDEVALVQIPLAQPFARLTVCYGMLAAGASIAFPHGDENVLESLGSVAPTMLFLFPTALDPLKRQIKSRVSGGPKWTQGTFEWALKKARTARAEGQQRPPWFVDRFILSRIRAQLGGRLRFAYVGGGVADGDLLSFLQDAGIATYEGYSLSEGTPLAALSRPEDTGVAESIRYDRGIVGRPLPGIEVKIEPAGFGEICVKGLVNMRGYWREEREAQAVLAGDGWLRTGDLGYVDAQGYIVIQDRKADTFRLADGQPDHYVAPAVVEAELRKSPLVRDVCVVGRDRPFPIALVVPDFKELAKRVFKDKPDLAKKATRRSLLANPASCVAATIELGQLAAKLAETPWAQPKAYRLLSIEFTEAVELTPAGTLRRNAIEDRFKNQIDEVYAKIAAEEAALAAPPTATAK